MDDLRYFRRRSRDELIAANFAKEGRAQAAHRELARRYIELCNELAEQQSQASNLRPPGVLLRMPHQKMSDDKMKKKQGFAAIDPALQREIASKGGKASSGNFANDPQRASSAGKKGGKVSPKKRTDLGR